MSAVSAQHDGHWRTGNDFQRQLQTPADIGWQEVPLREGLNRLANAHRVAIFIDRRIDPDQKVTYQNSDAALRELLMGIAASAGAGVGEIGSVVYIGPASTCSRLATLIALQRERLTAVLPPERYEVLVERRLPWSWEDFSEPRAIVEEIMSGANLRVVNLSVIPHDLWRGQNMPAMSVPEKLTLMLTGFRYAFRLSKDGANVKLVRFPAVLVLSRDYDMGDRAEKVARQLADGLPGADVQLNGQTVAVKSTKEDHVRIEAWLAGGSAPWNQRPIAKPTDAKKFADKRLTLTVEKKPIGAVLKTLSRNLQFEIEYAPNAQQYALQLATFSVEHAKFEDLMSVMLRPAGLQWEWADVSKIRISRVD